MKAEEKPEMDSRWITPWKRATHPTEYSTNPGQMTQIRTTAISTSKSGTYRPVMIATCWVILAWLLVLRILPMWETTCHKASSGRASLWPSSILVVMIGEAPVEQAAKVPIHGRRWWWRTRFAIRPWWPRMWQFLTRRLNLYRCMSDNSKRLTIAHKSRHRMEGDWAGGSIRGTGLCRIHSLIEMAVSWKT